MKWQMVISRGGVTALVLTALAWPVAAQQFQAPDIEIWEGETAVFEFTLPHAYGFAVRYAYTTRDGSAKAGDDYQAKQGHVVFPADIQSAEVRVRTLYDDDIVDNQYFELVLSDLQGQRIGSNTWTPAFIKNLPSAKTVRAQILDRE